MNVSRILCAVDPEVSDTLVADAAITLAGATQASLTFVSVIPLAKSPGTIGFGMPGSNRFGTTASADFEVKGGREAQVVEALQGRKVAAQQVTRGEVEIQVSHGSPEDTLVALAQSGDYDLVVIGGGGKHGLLSSLLGSISYKVVRSSPCSVFVVRAQPA